jgi:hypothetical protein
MQQREKKAEPIGGGLRVLDVEYVTPAKSHTLELQGKVADECYLGEDGGLVIVLPTTGRLRGEMPVSAVDEIYSIVL